jgi:hypothetical protein
MHRTGVRAVAAHLLVGDRGVRLGQPLRALCTLDVKLLVLVIQKSL